LSSKQLNLGISYYAQAIGIYWRLRKYLKRNFLTDLNFPSALEQEYFYGSKYYNRTKQYMHANHFFGELLCVLRGSKMDDVERKRFANLSACAPIFDDFFDKEHGDLEKIKRLLNDVNTEIPETEEQKLATIFLQNILADITNADDFLDAANHLFDAQEKAKKQQSLDSEPKQLWDLSRQKGGYSGLMYALLLNPDLSDQEKEIAFELGAFGQFMDDVFDLYDDSAAGVYTLPNTSKSVAEIELFFFQFLESILKKGEAFDGSVMAKKDFANILQIFSGAIRLAFQQYASIELQYKISPKECLKIERKHWIVDMEKPQNAFKMFRIGLSHLN
jgi:hypothetical protein